MSFRSRADGAIRWIGAILLHKLTGMAADVVRDCRVELALGWLWCNKRRDPLPRVPPDLFNMLIFVRDEGGQDVDAAYKGRDYFEDCLRLALRNSQSAGVLETRTRGGADRRGSWKSGTPEPDCCARALTPSGQRR